MLTIDFPLNSETVTRCLAESCEGKAGSACRHRDGRKRWTHLPKVIALVINALAGRLALLSLLGLGGDIVADDEAIILVVVVGALAAADGGCFFGHCENAVMGIGAATGVDAPDDWREVRGLRAGCRAMEWLVWMEAAGARAQRARWELGLGAQRGATRFACVT